MSNYEHLTAQIKQLEEIVRMNAERIHNLTAEIRNSKAAASELAFRVRMIRGILSDTKLEQQLAVKQARTVAEQPIDFRD